MPEMGPHCVPLVMSVLLRGYAAFDEALAQLAASSETAATATMPMLTANFLRLTMCHLHRAARLGLVFESRRRNSGSSYGLAVPGCFLRVAAERGRGKVPNDGRRK